MTEWSGFGAEEVRGELRVGSQVSEMNETGLNSPLAVASEFSALGMYFSFYCNQELCCKVCPARHRNAPCENTMLRFDLSF